MEPEPYWGWLSDQLIHLIHQRILDHIKHAVETKGDLPAIGARSQR